VWLACGCVSPYRPDCWLSVGACDLLYLRKKTTCLFL